MINQSPGRLQAMPLPYSQSVSRGHAPVAEWMVWILLAVAFLIGPFRSGGRGWLTYILPDAIGLIAIAAVYSQSLANRRRLLQRSPLTTPIILLAAFCLFEMFNPTAPFLRSLAGIRSWILYLAFFFVGFHVVTSKESLRRFYWLLIVLGVTTALYGVYQWQGGPESLGVFGSKNVDYAEGLTWLPIEGEAVFRALSTFTAPGIFAANMAFLMALTVGAIGSRYLTNWSRLISAVAFAVMGLGIAVSGSRSGVVHLMMMFLLLPIVGTSFSSRIRALVVGSLVAVLSLWFIAGRVGIVLSERFATIFDTDSIFELYLARMVHAAKVAVSNPLGSGLGYTAGIPRFIDSETLRGLPTTNVDSGYGSAAAELGLVGLIIFIYFAVKIGVWGIRAWKALPPGVTKDLLLGPALWAGIYPIFAIAAQPQAQLPSSIYFWLLIGALMGAYMRTRTANENRLLRPALPAQQ